MRLCEKGGGNSKQKGLEGYSILELRFLPLYLMVQDIVFTEVTMHEVARLVQSPDDDDHFSVKAAHALRGKARVPQPWRRHAVVPDELHDKDVESELDRHRRIDPSL